MDQDGSEPTETEPLARVRRRVEQTINPTTMGFAALYPSYSLLFKYSLLKAMLAVPLSKMWVRPIRWSSWLKRTTGLVDDGSNSVGIVRLARDQYFQIIGQADQTTVEHPMSGTRQSDPIAHDVRPVCLHWPNVRRRDFCAPHSVDEL
jgi:hypothetical protein